MTLLLISNINIPQRILNLKMIKIKMQTICLNTVSSNIISIFDYHLIYKTYQM